MPKRPYLSMEEAASALGKNVTTVRKWLRDTETNTPRNPNDRRAKRISFADLRQLAKAHDITLLSLVDEEIGPPPGTRHKPSWKEMFARMAAQDAIIADLRQRVEALEAGRGNVWDRLGAATRAYTAESDPEAQEPIHGGINESSSPPPQDRQSASPRRPKRQASEPKESVEILLDLPPGTISLRELAAQHGMPYGTVMGHTIDKQIKETKVPNLTRPGNFLHYFTPAQQVAAVYFWERSGNPKFHPCPQCPHGSVDEFAELDRELASVD